jgi:hypothetical protein
MEHEYWQRRIDLSRQTNAPSYGVGSFTEGNILLIGERASNPDLDPLVPEHPFCSSVGCSGWLNKKFQEEGIDEDKLFWINAFLKDGTKVEIKSVIDMLKPSAVVSLGVVAKNECIAEGIQCYGSYHPQYWKRFKSKYRYPLLDLLKFLQITIQR